MAWQNLPSTSTPINATNLNSLSNSIEEGSWTPVIAALSETAPTVTYSRQFGRYKKIGSIVFFRFNIRAKITALNGTNNYAVINGLPYEATASALGDYAFTFGALYSAVNDYTNATMCPYSNYLRVQGNYGASAIKWVVTATSYMEIAGSGFYFTS